MALRSLYMIEWCLTTVNFSNMSWHVYACVVICLKCTSSSHGCLEKKIAFLLYFQFIIYNMDLSQCCISDGDAEIER